MGVVIVIQQKLVSFVMVVVAGGLSSVVMGLKAQSGRGC